MPTPLSMGVEEDSSEKTFIQWVRFALPRCWLRGLSVLLRVCLSSQ